MMVLTGKDTDDSDGDPKIGKTQRKKAFLPGFGWLKSFFHRDSRRDSFAGSGSVASTAATTTPTATPFRNRDVAAQMRQVFRVIDSNGDGKISPEELGDVLRRLGHDKSTASKEAEGMVTAVDRDGDGLIDIEEFMQAVVVDDASNSCGAGDGDEEDLVAAFQVFDANKDGYISARELRRVMRGLRQLDGCCSLRRCARMIRAVDRNGDGRVDFEEFRMLMTTAGRRPAPDST